MSQGFTRTESRILGAPSKLDEFPFNPQVRTLSGTIPGTSQNNDLKNREPTGDRYLNDIHPEVEFSARRTSNSVDSDPEGTNHIYRRKFTCGNTNTNFQILMGVITFVLLEFVSCSTFLFQEQKNYASRTSASEQSSIVQHIFT